jgi:hypothetical protein
MPRKLALMLSLLSIVTLTGSMSGCDDTTFRYMCPTLKIYSAEFQDKVLAEQKSAGPNTRILINDYIQLRDACRAMEAGR